MRAVSLVQEPMIGVLNRRFVFCFYDAFAVRRGGDKQAADFFKKNGGRSYGAIFTPEGKCLSYFGFDMPDVTQALAKSRKQAADHWWMTDAEKAILARAAKQPKNLKAQLAAAELHSELLDVNSAVKVLNDFINATDSEPDKQIARYWSAHHRLTGNNLRYHTYGRRTRISAEEKKRLSDERAELRKIFARLKNLPRDLEDDRALDLLSMDVGLRRARGFYTGWEFHADVKKDAVVGQLKKLIADNPSSNRIGQMHFLMGLAKANSGDLKAADVIWKNHFEKYPADRFSMLSRFHHTEYQFSPHGGGRGARVVGGRRKRLSKEEVERVLKSLKPRKKTASSGKK